MVIKHNHKRPATRETIRCISFFLLTMLCTPESEQILIVSNPLHFQSSEIYNQTGQFSGTLTDLTLKSSINCSLNNRTFGPAYRLYSSKTDVKFHLCNFLRHATTVPVRCLPRLQLISSGYFVTSRTFCNAFRTV